MIISQVQSKIPSRFTNGLPVLGKVSLLGVRLWRLFLLRLLTIL